MAPSTGPCSRAASPAALYTEGVRICLATLHSNADFIPLALLYLKAFLVRGGLVSLDDAIIVEDGPDTPADALAARVIETDPHVLALSCYVWNIKTLMAAAQRVKAARPEIVVVLGGPEVGPVAVSALDRYSWVDAVVKSEGEAPLGAIVQHVACDQPFDDIPGICFRRGSAVIDTGDAPIRRNLDELPSPHTEEFAMPGHRIACVETQRGCVFRCSFCFYNKDLSIRNRRFDLDRVFAEIRFWLDRDIKQLYLMDPVFNLNAERAKQICRFVADHNHRRIPIHTEVWAEFIDEEIAALMEAAHFRFIEVGLQTTDDDVLATVERRLRLQKFLDGVGYLKKYALPFELQLIYGLPGDTRARFRKSLDFAAALQPTCLAVFPLMVLPGTELWRNAAGLGLEHDADPPYYVRSHRSMDAEDIAYGWKIHDAIGELEPFHTISVLRREPGVPFSKLVDEWIDDGTGDLEAFVQRVCDAHRIPPDFYVASARLEQAAIDRDLHRA